jgi:hypothetical protein
MRHPAKHQMPLAGILFGDTQNGNVRGVPCSELFWLMLEPICTWSFRPIPT